MFNWIEDHTERKLNMMLRHPMHYFFSQLCVAILMLPYVRYFYKRRKQQGRKWYSFYDTQEFIIVLLFTPAQILLDRALIYASEWTDEWNKLLKEEETKQAPQEPEPELKEEDAVATAFVNKINNSEAAE